MYTVSHRVKGVRAGVTVEGREGREVDSAGTGVLRLGTWLGGGDRWCGHQRESGAREGRNASKRQMRRPRRAEHLHQTRTDREPLYRTESGRLGELWGVAGLFSLAYPPLDLILPLLLSTLLLLI